MQVPGAWLRALIFRYPRSRRRHLVVARRAQVLDEADRMLDMGFQEDVQKVVDCLPSLGAFSRKERTDKDVQTLLFSATIPAWVKNLTAKYMKSPETIDLVEGQAAHASLDVTHYMLQV